MFLTESTDTGRVTEREKEVKEKERCTDLKFGIVNDRVDFGNKKCLKNGRIPIKFGSFLQLRF